MKATELKIGDLIKNMNSGVFTEGIVTQIKIEGNFVNVWYIPTKMKSKFAHEGLDGFERKTRFNSKTDLSKILVN